MKDDLRSEESIKRAEAFAASWPSPFVCAHRLHSGRTHKSWVEVPKRARQTSCCPPPARPAAAGKLRLSVVQPGLLAREHRNREPGCTCRADSSRCRCKTEPRTSSFLHLKLIYTILLHSFNTYRKFILRRDLSTSRSCVGNISPCFSWTTMTETPTVNHPRR